MGGGIGRIALGAVGFGLGSMVGFPALGASLMMGLGGMLGGAPKQEKKQRQVKGMLGSSSVEGTPLAEWPIMSRSQVEELSFHNVKTVEQLVAMSDSLASQFMGMNGLKAKAKMWLEDSEETARINKIQSLEAAIAIL